MAGLPVDRDRLYEIAQRRGLRVIEDAAQSMGASWRGRRIGSFGDLVAISFHANKNITTGEGGCLVTSDAAETDLCTRLRLQGVVRLPDGNQEVEVAGGKHNLTDIAARIGLGQMKQLEGFTARRRALARRYFERFDTASGCELPLEDYANCNWHMFQVLLPLARLRIDRGAFIQALHLRGIGSGVHYPALHLFKLYRELGYNSGDFPEAERIGSRTLTLPLFPAMADADVDRVCAAVAEIVRDNMR
jgi:dTDP-4-amino-4,6-dideoxygalactose transaminase